MYTFAGMKTCYYNYNTHTVSRFLHLSHTVRYIYIARSKATLRHVRIYRILSKIIIENITRIHRLHREQKPKISILWLKFLWGSTSVNFKEPIIQSPLDVTQPDTYTHTHRFKSYNPSPDEKFLQNYTLRSNFRTRDSHEADADFARLIYAQLCASLSHERERENGYNPRKIRDPGFLTDVSLSHTYIIHTISL